MSKQDQAQIYQMLSVLFLTISKGEQALQGIREVMTSHPLFNPMSLFRYLTKGASTLKLQNLLLFLDQNKEEAKEEEVKAIMQLVTAKKVMQYRDFLEFVYPFNSAVLREINTCHLKRYPKLQKFYVHETTVAGFLILLTEQLWLLRRIQVQKGDSLNKISKERLKRVLLTLKKAGDKQASHCQNDDTRITSLELRNFMKAFVSVEDCHFLFLSRRLGIKKGSFPLEDLQKFIRPIKKMKKQGGFSTIADNVDENSAPPQRQFNDRQYKQEIYEELASSFVDTRPTKRAKKTQKRMPLAEQRNNTFEYDVGRTAPVVPQSANYFLEKAPQDSATERASSTSPKQLLIDFIQVFLPSAKALQDLRKKVSKCQLDYLSLFKRIDRSGRGVVGAEDLHHYYSCSGGSIPFSVEQFELIIERYGQSDEPWMSLTEFCEMIRSEERDGEVRGPAKLGEDPEEFVLKIMEVSLRSELSLLKIRKAFRPHESKYLFDLISRENNGYINYQELKWFLSENGLSLSMYDIMSVLKRLDRSRNGVVEEQQFVSYFQPIDAF